MTQSQKNSAKQIDYWTASNPNSFNDYDDGLSPVWTNHTPKAAILVRTSSVIVYKRANHDVNGWTIPDSANWA